MRPLKAHIVHVGNIANKGTQALLISDISVIREIAKGNVVFSISTTDIDGVKGLKLPLKAVVQPMVDIPYEKADSYAKRFRYQRDSLRYKAFGLASLLYMFLQVFLSMSSAVLVKAGFEASYRPESLVYMKDCDVVVSCSDENFKECSSMLPLNVYWIITWWSMLISRVSEILVAKLLGKPVVMFPNSLGPFRTIIGRSLSKLALNNCDFVLVRDPISYDFVKSLRIRSPKMSTSDTTLIFNPSDNSQLPRNLNRTVGVSPGIYSHSLSGKKICDYISAHAKALDKTIEKYDVSVVFLPHYVSGFSYDDLEICRLILDKMKYASHANIVVARTAEEFKTLINQTSIVISSKMHPAVFAASAHAPALCIAYDHKQTGFFMSLGLSELVIPVTELSYETLLSKIDYVWNNRNELKVLLEERVPKLRIHVKKSIRHAISPFIKRD